MVLRPQGPASKGALDMDKQTETRIILLRGSGLADRDIAARLGLTLAAVKRVK